MTRRTLLTMLGAGGVAALVTAAPDAQAGHEGSNVLHLGQFNTAPGGAFDGSTLLTADAGSRVLDVRNTRAGGGDAGAIQAWSRGGGPAVQGNATANLEFPPQGTGVGVLGISGSGAGVFGFSDTGHAVEGHTAAGTQAAVRGVSTDGPGVEGMSQTGAGVRGTGIESGIGVHAMSPEGTALAVSGVASFSSAGAAVVAEGELSVEVAHERTTADSHVTVTLTSDPGPRTVQWVERRPGVGFVVHLTPAPRRARHATSLTYLVVEPAGA